MDLYYITVFFIFGIIFGSFFNVCIYRIPSGESIAFPPSHCTSCNTRLKPIDLVPIFSYLFLKGKCRYCGEKISPRYAIVEFGTGVIFAAVYVRYGLTLEALKYLVLASFIIIIGMIDYDTTDVYSVTTYSGIACGILFIIIDYLIGNSIKTYLFGGLLGGGVIGLIVLLTRGMGEGDIEICALSGLFLGLSNSIVMLFFSFVIGGITGIILVATGKKSRKDYIPFGPYIAVATLIAMFFGERLISMYLNWA